MSKFKVGDIVVGNDLSNERYEITRKCENWKGEVIKIFYEGFFLARGLEGKNLYSLDENFFELAPNFEGSEDFLQTEQPKGIKYDQEKTDWLQLPFRELEEVTQVMMIGEEKYSKENWKFVKPKERYLQAALRHIITHAQGEKLDEETNKKHLAHAVCCLLFLMWHENEEGE